MGDIWNANVVQRFARVPVNPREQDYHGPFCKLLSTEFDVTGRFTVTPQSFPLRESRGTFVDFIVEYTVELDDKPVLVLELKAPSKLSLASAREEADWQMRSRLRDIYEQCPLPRLYGISTFGTNFCIYKLDKEQKVMEPAMQHQSEKFLSDTAPIEWWTEDLLSEPGASVVKNLFNEVKEMCNSL